MPDPRVAKLTASDVYRRRDELVARERSSIAAWAELDLDSQAGMLALIRETLLRLLEDPGWVPGAFKVNPSDRIDVTFTVDLSEMDEALRRAGWRELRDDALRQSLVNMAKKLRGPTT